jgi:outer membrane receptor for ferrienterochelin and colicins
MVSARVTAGLVGSSPGRRKRAARRAALALTSALLAASAARADDGDGARPDLGKLTFDELFAVRVTTPSKFDDGLLEITEKAIRDYGATSLIEVLERVVGTYAVGTYYLRDNQLAFRGNADPHYNTRTLFLIDGRPVRESLFGGANVPLYTAFPLGRIAHIELVRGPGSVLYGTGAYFAVINIITKDATRQRESASVSFGSFDTQQAEAGVGFEVGELGVSLGATFKSSEGWRWDSAVLDGRDPQARHSFPLVERNKGVNARADLGPFTASAFYATSVQEITFSCLSAPVFPPDSDCPPEIYLEIGRFHADLGHRFTPTQSYQLSTNLTYNGIRLRQHLDQQADDIREAGTSDDLALELTNLLEPHPSLRVAFGAVGHLHTGHVDTFNLDRDGQPFNLYGGRPNPAPYQGVPRYRQLWWSAYAQGDYRPARALKLTAGAQVNKPQGGGFHAVPRVGLLGAPASWLRLRLSYGMAFRSPSFFEQRFNTFNPGARVQGNLALRPETVTTYEAGLSLLRGDAKVDLTVFRSDQRALINRRVTQGNLQVYDNFGTSRSVGFELELNHRVSRAVALEASLAYARMRTGEGERDVFGLPALAANAGGSFALHEGLQLGVFYSFFGPGTDYRPASRPNPPVSAVHHVTANVTANLTELLGLAGPAVSLGLYVVNLLDDAIHHPEYNLRNINSIPGRGPRQIFLSLETEW